MYDCLNKSVKMSFYAQLSDYFLFVFKKIGQKLKTNVEKN